MLSTFVFVYNHIYLIFKYMFMKVDQIMIVTMYTCVCLFMMYAAATHLVHTQLIDLI
jgi:hypothetical protein